VKIIGNTSRKINVLKISSFYKMHSIEKDKNSITELWRTEVRRKNGR
jgi:hypothetical protein